MKTIMTSKQREIQFADNSTMKQIVETVWLLMPIMKECKTKKDVVTRYNNSISALQRIHAELRNFIHDAVLANVQVYCGSENAARLLQDGLQQFHIPQWSFADPEILDWEITAMPTGDLLALCKETISSEVEKVVREFFDLLNEMVDLNYFGLWQLHNEAEDSALYYFFRCVVSEQHVRSRYETYFRVDVNSQKRNANDVRIGPKWEITKHHKVFNQKIVYERHEHHLYNAKVRDLSFRIKKPKFIQKLCKRIPKVLFPFVKIVEGDMCKEDIRVSTILEKTREEECPETARFVDFVELMSPAVVIDRYVVSGWADRDLR